MESARAWYGIVAWAWRIRARVCGGKSHVLTFVRCGEGGLSPAEGDTGGPGRVASFFKENRWALSGDYFLKLISNFVELKSVSMQLHMYIYFFNFYLSILFIHSSFHGSQALFYILRINPWEEERKTLPWKFMYWSILTCLYTDIIVLFHLTLKVPLLLVSFIYLIFK